MNNYFIFNSKVMAKADVELNNKTVKKLWNSFCFGCSELEFTAGEALSFILGEAQTIDLTEGKEYSLCVNEKGAAIVGRDYGGLMRGLISLLMKIEYISLEDGKESFKIPCIREDSNYRINNRMIHICVFPENDLYFIKKLIRLSALCQYTHIVIEFWGMLKYDCLKELAWPHAFTKLQAKELIEECRELGIKPIPMFNQLGHAAASRGGYGKHVVLDQNPRLQHLFIPDGWAWDITSEKTYELLRNVRHELYELFGDTEYIHLGCDEAYYYMNCDELRKQLPSYLNRLTNDVVKENRRPMMWMDMILVREKYPGNSPDEYYYGFGKPGEAEELLASLAKETVMVDWQYEVFEAPFKSSIDLKDKGRDLIVAPWLNPKNFNASIDTVADNDLFGIMLTTWHTLKHQIYGVVGCAKKMGAVPFHWSQYSRNEEETAALLRRVSFEGNSYADCGWSKEQIEV